MNTGGIGLSSVSILAQWLEQGGPMKNKLWMDMARMVSKSSKDPRTKVGAVIVDSDNHIVSSGYNGMVKGCNEKGMWDNKYPFVIHAEMNAAMFSRKEYLGGCFVYTTLSPCINCLKHLFQMGVRVIYYDRLYDRFTEQDKHDIALLLNSMNCLVQNINNEKKYQEDLVCIK